MRTHAMMFIALLVFSAYAHAQQAKEIKEVAIEVDGEKATYKPKTAFDNTPWRFSMNQNGRMMTADEFDAWMKSRGIRVVKGRKPVDVPVAPVKGNPAAGQ